MNQQTIAVFGESLVDDFITEQVVGGAPFNVARNLAAFGVATLMVTRIGEDKNGALVRREFERFGMTEAGLQIDALEATGRVVVERNEAGHRFIILPDQAYDYVAAAPALAALAASKPSVLYFGTMAQRHETSRATVRAMLDASKAQRYLDLNVRDGQVTERCAFESLHLADIVKVNEEELKDLFKWYTHTQPGTKSVDSREMVDACQALMRTFNLQTLIVTLGERGAIVFEADGTVTINQQCHAPAHIVDTVGAGDAFSAVFLYGQAQGWPLPLTLARANAFAGAICGVAGAVPNDIGFYAPWLAAWHAGQVLPPAADLGVAA
ncbi:UNVERIFIED_ORG: fructokinase [Zoogloea ramigera]|uniref:PfkB family carbohydrate kinase n=1 Tax=Duganella zoogloeoides TaxID=75659 RepID=A0ABZ0Y037_9BURK|nr:PfkB family carbohydrate kinase [Duganella zoogloeoides]WQH04847.1 PfkB family carbohydrate kinase [Duganella zoogloeoides]